MRRELIVLYAITFLVLLFFANENRKLAERRDCIEGGVGYETSHEEVVALCEEIVR